ncbi:MAG TPA: hypothetical protein DHW52_06180, partial [Alcanivorax sp.]|nr:hypothetical protein [Alcanivorax sp.]
MNKSFAALAINFVGFQLLWFVAVYGGAHGWGWAAWLVLVAMQAGVWALNRAWRADLALLAAGAAALPHRLGATAVKKVGHVHPHASLSALEADVDKLDHVVPKLER